MDVVVVLLKEHTHKRVKYPVGYRLSLAKPIADWLIEQKVAEAATAGQTAQRARAPSKRGVGCCGGGWR